MCACVCGCDEGADMSDRGVVLLLKLCRWPLGFEEAREERRSRAGEGRERRAKKIEEEKGNKTNFENRRYR